MPIEKTEENNRSSIVHNNEKTAAESLSFPLEEGSSDGKIPTLVCEVSREDISLEVEHRKRVDEVELLLDEDSNDLLNNYAALCGNNSLLLGEGLFQDTKYTNPSMTSQSCSVSVGDSINNSYTASASESIQSILEDSLSIGNSNSLQQWPVEGSVDSIFSWDDFDYLEQGDFSFF
ncbi:hypothetical protein CRG98_011245 [Punica granatum]|nr:hypothetical protein CRG98_011245 [Punica granatum]